MRLFGRKKPVEPAPQADPGPQLPPGPEVGADGLRSLADHRNYVLSLVEPLPPFGMQLLDALDLAICEEITAPAPLPRATTAAESGFAVRAGDVAGASHDEPVTLDVVDPARVERLDEGCAVPIDEHQVLPDGADAVLPTAFTDSRRDEDEAGPGNARVRVFEPVRSDEHVIRAGADVEDGQVLVRHGQVLDTRVVGLLAGAGIDKVLARPRPRIVVISTGKGLVEPGRRLPDHLHSHDANGYMLAALARSEGCQVWRLGVVSEDLDEVRETITDQLIRADLIISTGGFREGDGDLLSQVIPELGPTDYAEVAMNPGRQQGFALIGEDKVPMVLLPGDPVGAYVSYEAFVRPIIRRLMGTEPVVRPTVRAITRSVIRSKAGVFELPRAVVTTEHQTSFVELAPGRDQARLSDLAASNALVLLDEQTEVVQAGSAVQCWVLD